MRAYDINYNGQKVTFSLTTVNKLEEDKRKTHMHLWSRKDKIQKFQNNIGKAIGTVVVRAVFNNET